ncbi:MAG: ABC transporter substrate-binding protein [Anaerolineae bacterium]|nr:ABC transporter substrate-binding protein [Anaerolineae bacterium]MDW8170933.1 ABC transporter substrate-binding protein [Anaerolineae bacterium]
MKHNKLITLFAAWLALVAAPTLGQAAPALEANLTEECVAEYDPDVDYFPDKVTITDAVNFSVEYFNNYKLVTVTNAFDGAEPFTYVLVQCGTPAPEADDFPVGTQFIEVPAGNIIAMSTTQLPHLTDLGLLDKLVGLDSFLFVNSPEVRQLINDGKLVEIGSGAEVNAELVLETDPDIVMTFGFNPSTDAHPVLIQAGIFTALNAEWREPTPLARAEWIKYTALFYNAEARAEQVYADIVAAYDEARRLAASVPEAQRPVVLWNTYSSFSESWSIPGAETYVGALIRDAGGIIALSDEAPQNSASLSFEAVYGGALEADVWVTNAFMVNTLDDLLALDSRYADFAAVKEGNVWNNSLDVNENGGNNYFEKGVTNPHLILRDLVAIFHPQLLPDHQFNFYLRLEPKGQ